MRLRIGSPDFCRLRFPCCISTLHITALAPLALLAGCSSAKLPQAAVSPAPVASAATAPASAKPAPAAPAVAQKVSSSSTGQAAATTPSSTAPASPAPFDTSVFEVAADKAASATSIAQSAQSQDDWNLAAERWQQAIALLKTVPTSHPKRSIARVRIGEYQRQMAEAQRRAKGESAPPVVASTGATNSNESIIVDAPGSTGAAGAAEMALARHLRNVGAKMYGAYWCSTCHWQQEQFGAAFSQIPYVECDPAGNNAQPDMCDRAGISAYPTWELNGRLYRPGAFRLEQLAEMSGYRGPRNFSS